MSVETGLFGVALLFILLAMRVPVALALIAVSFSGVTFLLGLTPAIGILSNTPYSFVSNWTLSAEAPRNRKASAEAGISIVSLSFSARDMWTGRDGSAALSMPRSGGTATNRSLYL